MKQSFNFDRRINRITYFIGLILGFAGLLGVAIVLSVIDTFLPHGGLKLLDGIVVLASALTYAFYALCLTRQRANDISGDNALLFTFLAIFILSLIIGVIPGERKANRYGDIPRRGISLK